MRVLHCIETLGFGGVEQRRLLLARGLDPQRFEQRLLCTRSMGPLAADLRAAGMPVEEVGRLRTIADPRSYAAALRCVQAFRPHVIHGAVFEGNALAMIAGRLGGVGVRIAEETSDPTNRSWRGNLLIRSVYRLADAVVGVSPAVAAYLGRLRVPARKIVLIENSVSVPRKISDSATAALKDELGFGKNDLIVGSVGRLGNDHKRISDLIEAVCIIGSQLPSVRLIVVGDGPDRVMLEGIAASRGVGDKCRFVGFQRDTALYYSLMDVFVLPSTREAFGLVLAEAMLAGVPAVATSVGGIPDVLAGGDAGLLVPPRRPDLLAAAIQSLLGDATYRSRVAEAGRRHAELHYRPERYIAEVASLYERLSVAGKS